MANDKRQMAHGIRAEDLRTLAFCLLPIAFYLLPFTFPLPPSLGVSFGAGSGIVISLLWVTPGRGP